MSDEPPIVQIMAPEDWWREWRDTGGSTRRKAGEWERKFLDLSAALKARFGIVIECVFLQGISLANVTWDDRGPRLGEPPTMCKVWLDRAPICAPAVR